MKNHTHLNEHCSAHRQDKAIQSDGKREPLQIDCSALNAAFRGEFMKAINKGALSRCVNLIDVLEEGECKKWLAERLSEMDFDTIRSSIVSA